MSLAFAQTLLRLELRDSYAMDAEMLEAWRRGDRESLAAFSAEADPATVRFCAHA